MRVAHELPSSACPDCVAASSAGRGSTSRVQGCAHAARMQHMHGHRTNGRRGRIVRAERRTSGAAEVQPIPATDERSALISNQLNGVYKASARLGWLHRPVRVASIRFALFFSRHHRSLYIFNTLTQSHTVIHTHTHSQSPYTLARIYIYWKYICLCTDRHTTTTPQHAIPSSSTQIPTNAATNNSAIHRIIPPFIQPTNQPTPEIVRSVEQCVSASQALCVVRVSCSVPAAQHVRKYRVSVSFRLSLRSILFCSCPVRCGGDPSASDVQAIAMD